jgi:hypothetical protein
MRRLLGSPSPLLSAAVLSLLTAFVALSGCRQAGPSGTTTGSPAAPSANATAAKPAGKTTVKVYINVTSGCQADTVNLLNTLGMDYRDCVDLEIIDFGSPEGEQRWRADGLDCLTLLFNGSPAVKFPGADGALKTVTFFMPAGFNWTHDDLKEAFAAIKAGKLQSLSEEQANKETEPRAVSLKVTTHKSADGAEVLINGTPCLTLKTAAGGQSPAQRATIVQQGLQQWASSPLHPTELTVATAAGDTVLMARGYKLITVTEADARAAGLGLPKNLALQWLNGLKKPVVAAMPPADAAPADAAPAATSNAPTP